MSKHLELRPEVAAFAQLMEQKLRENDHKPGWKKDAPLALNHRVREETEELCRAIIRGAGPLEIALEAADVANMAMMVADVCGGLDEGEGCHLCGCVHESPPCESHALPLPPAPTEEPEPAHTAARVNRMREARGWTTDASTANTYCLGCGSMGSLADEDTPCAYRSCSEFHRALAPEPAPSQENES